MAYEVSVVKCNSYSQYEVDRAVRKSIELIGSLSGIIKKNDRVLLKPNLLSSDNPEKAVTTHPAVVRAVAKLFLEVGCKVVIGDSPGGRNTFSSYNSLLEKTGIKEVAQELGIETALFDKETIDVSGGDTVFYKKFNIARVVNDADVIVTLPKLKTHEFTYFTGAVKIVYGCIPGLQKTGYHASAGKSPETFSDMLVDLFVTINPKLSIMDAIVGMDGDGPSAGNPKNIGLILASKSSTALDFVAASIVGMNPLSIPTIRIAARRKIGPTSLDEIKILGESIDNVIVKDFKPPSTSVVSRITPYLIKIIGKSFTAKPLINESKCVRCRKCVEVCPTRALTIKNKEYPKYDYSKCIRCYCCHEICPQKAIYIKRALISKLMDRPRR